MSSPILNYQPGGGVPVGIPGQPPSVGYVTQLIVGQSYIDVAIAPQTSASWIFVELDVVNTIDANPLNIWPGIVTSKTTSGFRVYLNGMPDSSNYYLHWAITGTTTAPPVPATSYLLTGPSSGAISAAATFMVALPIGTTVAAPVTVTPHDSGAGGSFAPTTILLTTGAPSGVFNYTPASYGAKTISCTNDGSLSNPANLTFTAVAATYTLTGPSTGGIAPSTNFTVALPAGGVVIGTVTITPNDSSGGGSFTPTTVGLTTGAPSATFTYLPASSGAKTIASTNNGGLTNPSSLTYTVVDTGHLLNTLISYWKLDEASGTRNDSQGTNHLTILTNAPLGVAGKINNGCKFISASSQALSIGNNGTLQVTSDFTFSFWLNLTSIVANTDVLDKAIAGVPSDYGLFPHVTAGLVFWVNDPSLYAVAVGTPATTGVWYHVVAWYDSSDTKLRLRINDTTTFVSSMTCVLAQTGGGLGLGVGRRTGTDLYADCIIDEVGFWKRVLTAQEITALYNSGAGLPYSSFTT